MSNLRREQIRYILKVLFTKINLDELKLSENCFLIIYYFIVIDRNDSNIQSVKN